MGWANMASAEGVAMKSLDAMIGYLIVAFAFFAAVPVAQAGMQGNLPAPVQKLPPYPPVVCVASNWATESCESRRPPAQPAAEFLMRLRQRP